MAGKIKSSFNLKVDILILILIFLFGSLLRAWFVSDGSIIFGYDQARDAIRAEEILQGDLKLFGPTASGTQDSIFHGVLYYYFLSVIHLFAKNPIAVARILSIISMLSIFPIFLVTKYLTSDRKLSLLVALLTSISYESVTAGTWISNPALILIFLPIYVYYVTKLEEKFNLKNVVLSMTFLGICVQLILFEIYWIVPLIVIFLAQFKNNQYRFKLSQLKIWLAGFIALIFTTSSMIISEILMVKRGILNLSTIKRFNSGNYLIPSKLLLSIFNLLTNKFASSLSLPLGKLLFALVLTVGIIHLIYNSSRSVDSIKKLVKFLISPIIFLSLHFRNSPHIFIGYEFLIYILAVTVLSNLVQHLTKSARLIISFTLIILFAASNFYSLLKIKNTHNHPYAIQKGFLYKDQLAIIKKSYSLTEGQPFSISTITNPYGINVTWAYMFDQYGNEKNEHKPQFYGLNQTGRVGANLLTQKSHLEPKHLAIIEPNTGVNQIYIDTFMEDHIGQLGLPSKKFDYHGIQLFYWE